MPLNFDNIATTTLQRIRPRMADNIFKANPYSAWLLMQGRVKLEPGGKHLEEPLIYAKNNTVQSYRGYDRLNVGPTEELTAAKFNWRQAAAAVSMVGLEELQNAGPEQVFNLLQTKIKVTEMSAREWLNEKLLTATANKDLSRDFLGLDEIIENVAAGSQGTLGGINRQTYTWWANKHDTVDLTGAGATERKLTRDMITMYNEVSKGLTQPDLILANQHLYEWYEKENHDLLRLQDRSLLDVGFVNQRFKGAVMMWDEHVQGSTTTGNMYFINSEHLSLTLHSRRNFVMSPFVKPYDQDAKVAHILIAGNTTCNNSRHQGVLVASNIPTA